MKVKHYTNPNIRHRILHPVWIAAVLVIILNLVVPVGLIQAAPGVDGDLTVSSPNVVVNRYSAVTAISGNIITVNDITDLADGRIGHYTNDNLSVGDMLLIYQAQGASFLDSGDSPAYGTFTYNSSGRYEFLTVESVSGNDIAVDASNSPPYSCGGIGNSYDFITGNVQVVRVPQYSNLTIDSLASIVAPEWNGSVGGIVALLARDSLVVNGQIDASGSGFRGGRVEENSLWISFHVTAYRSNLEEDGAVKGESILGFEPEYNANNGEFGRGAPANGGGGGNAHNTGGGGGANGNNGGVWTGSGLPDLTVSSWYNAWDLDDLFDDPGMPIPSYFIGGAGGGRGGYSYAANNLDANTEGPNNFLWGGNSRDQAGGLGGRPLDNDPSTRVFFGGGGGSGDSNNRTGTPGAEGGGLVFIGTPNLSGSGLILANGNDGGDTFDEHNDGAGGGGAGGSVVVKANSVVGVTINASGGKGGSHGVPTPISDESFGPGGGGGGGFIAVDSSSGLLTMLVNGGSNGINESTALDEFLPNGATIGYEGAISTADFLFPGCLQPTAIDLLDIKIAADFNWSLLMILLILTIVSWITLKVRPSFFNEGR